MHLNENCQTCLCTIAVIFSFHVCCTQKQHSWRSVLDLWNWMHGVLCDLLIALIRKRIRENMTFLYIFILCENQMTGRERTVAGWCIRGCFPMEFIFSRVLCFCFSNLSGSSFIPISLLSFLMLMYSSCQIIFWIFYIILFHNIFMA